ncbi:MAG TPA: ABC transporter permease [Vicinamibacterales bacterium]|nr:ABC transporter permease [Vicinamibacterales bacterium]
MALLSELRTRVRAIARRSRIDREVDEELRDHIDREIASRAAGGMTDAEARRTTLRDFGGVALHKEDCRRSLGVQLWDDLTADLSYALRSLAREPGFSIVVVLTLALGIGANMTIYSAVDAVLLRPLPYPQQDRLVELHKSDLTQPQQRDDVSPANFLDWDERASDVVMLAAAEPYSVTYSKPEGPERLPTWLVTEHFFQVLGMPALIGRTFAPGEFTSGRDNVVVLGHGTWTREFGGDPAVVGRVIILDKQPFTIIGVMPPQFDFPRGRDVWAPKVFVEEERQRRGVAYYRAVGRLQPGVAREAAQARLDAVARQLRDEYPRENGNATIVAVPLKESVVGAARPILLIFLAGVGLLLVVAAANVTNLVLVRLMRRDQEFAVRSALGASAGRVRRQILTESIVMSTLGAATAAVLAMGSTNALRSVVPKTLPRADQMTVGWSTIAFGAALALTTAVAVCVAATRAAADARLLQRLSSQMRTVAGGRRAMQRMFVAAELAVATILLVTSGLFVRSLVTLLAEQRGFRTDNVAVATLFAWQEYPRPDQRAAFIKHVVDRIRDVPGVTDAGAGSSLPLAARIGPEIAAISAPGLPSLPAPVAAQASIVTPGYVEALGIPLLSGRRFTWFDDSRANQVVIVNERLARQYFRDRSPLGQRLVVRFAAAPVAREIVGVVGDVRRDLARPAEPAIYVPHAQSPTGSVTFVAHTSRDAAQMLAQIKQTISSVNGSIAVASVVTVDELLRATVSERRFSLQLVGFFALASLLLATVGAYGVMAAVANQRLKEIAIRVALGARRVEVVRVIVADGLAMAVLGVGVGLVAAALATRFVRDLLYGIAPLDTPTYVMSAIAIVIVTAGASGVPAVRATRTDVVNTLRGD